MTTIIIFGAAVRPDGRVVVEASKAKPAAKKDRFGGFNPYDNN